MRNGALINNIRDKLYNKYNYLESRDLLGYRYWKVLIIFFLFYVLFTRDRLFYNQVIEIE